MICAMRNKITSTYQPVHFLNNGGFVSFEFSVMLFTFSCRIYFGISCFVFQTLKQV